MNICIVTADRVQYLERCLNSIIMGSTERHTINVIDDCSADGTQEFLNSYLKKGLIHNVIFNKEKIGSAKSFNKIIDSTNGEWIVMTCDDMWFHRGWDKEVISVAKEEKDCGIVTFFNWRLFGITECSVIYNEKLWRSRSTGMGSVLLNRELYEKAGKFQIRGDKLMGFFAKPFCLRANAVSIKRNVHYSLRVPYASHMGEPQCKINLEKELEEYTKFRNYHKKGIK